MTTAVSPQYKSLKARYGVTTYPALLRAIRDEYTRETGERYTLDTAEAMLDGMLDAEYYRLEGGAPSADITRAKMDRIAASIRRQFPDLDIEIAMRWDGGYNPTPTFLYEGAEWATQINESVRDAARAEGILLEPYATYALCAYPA